MTDERHFHFVLKPVQEFVAQARRTRDFWAGSFLLSLLSAVAMREVKAQGGSILFPKENAAFLDALEARGNDKPPKQGVVPNRFKASAPKDFDARQVCEAVRGAWLAIASLAWERLPESLKDRRESVEVWRRQLGLHVETGERLEHDPFWQMTWALGGPGDGEDLVDRRRAMPIDRTPDEPGAKCTLMEGWQELSGVSRPSQEIREFWEKLAEHVNCTNASDLSEGEQLCAISLVKRLFPHSFENLRCKMPGDWSLRGWDIETGVPSVAYLAAAPWLTRVLGSIGEDQAQKFYAAAYKAGGRGEWRTHLRMVTEVAGRRTKPIAKLADLDGALFFDSSLDGREFERKKAEVAKLRPLLAQLKDLPMPTRDGAADAEQTLGEPDPFFAVLAMDGDNLGRHLQQRKHQTAISKALEYFTSRVREIVEGHSGFLVYAGGDDVIALLPVPEAIPCARELRSRYMESFQDIKKQVPSTLSGAVLFAHHKLPLTHVLRDAHHLLDDIAKKGRGRDALAVQVTSRGGELLRWARKWPAAFPDKARDGRLVLEDLALRMASADAPFPHKFFHRIDALVRLANPDPERGIAPLLDEDAVELFTAELLDSGAYRDDTEEAAQEPEEARQRRIDAARDFVRQLLRQCRVDQPHPRIEADGAFLLRFLGRRPSPNRNPLEVAQ